MVFLPGVKRPGREAEYSVSFRAEFPEFNSPVRLHGAVLINLPCYVRKLILTSRGRFRAFVDKVGEQRFRGFFLPSEVHSISHYITDSVT